MPENIPDENSFRRCRQEHKNKLECFFHEMFINLEERQKVDWNVLSDINMMQVSTAWRDLKAFYKAASVCVRVNVALNILVHMGV